MSSVLKSKLNNAAQSGETDGVSDGMKSRLEPLQILLCETLKAITHEIFDPADVTLAPLYAHELQAALDTPGLKLSFSSHDGAAHYFGVISPAFVTDYCQHSLLFAQDETASNKESGDQDSKSIAKEAFNPSMLDCLLMQPTATQIGECLAEILSFPAPMKTQIGLSFDALDVGKPALRAIGEAITLTLSIKPLTDDRGSSNQGPEDQSKDGQAPSREPLFIDLILPRALLKDMMRASPAKEASAPVLDPAHPWAVHMRQAVNAANVPVRAVVESCAMTVAECTRLEIGQVIALPGVTLDAVQLFIDMETGPKAKALPVSLAQGSLGIFKKNRALKMNEEIDPDFIKDMNLHII